ncbi:ATP-dependent protease La [Rhizoclosmatium globosum]|uniref:Lon protease homolog, mitochondrial n=1 Tax=Rhizoclosmatium globosum TaxID=329046 RepID=A0A1Y2D3E3_9FUNG|nr:ATP-dependent protease La [Rhizoclosmatium globosum]|eukprot:ORY53813.1 ATP-dependent protease La [Rhizoclosmatium globosum]
MHRALFSTPSQMRARVLTSAFLARRSVSPVSLTEVVRRHSNNSNGSGSGRGGRRSSLLRSTTNSNQNHSRIAIDIGENEKKLLLERLLDSESDLNVDLDAGKNEKLELDSEAKRGGGSAAAPPNTNSAPPSNAGDNSDSNSNNNNNSSVQKVSVPKEYPQTLAIPLTRRPLFPGFYKSLYIKDPHVIAAIQSLLDRRQPYVSIFLTKDEKYEPDTLDSPDQVHPVGVFAQITSVYNAGPDDKALTVVVYPHRRVHLDQLLPSQKAAAKADATTVVTASEKSVEEGIGGESTSALAEASAGRTFGTADASSKDTKQELGEEEDELDDGTVDKSGYNPINKHLAAHSVSVVNISNKVDADYDPESPTIKATISEILNVLKEISLMNPLLRDQILTFSIQTGGNAFQDAGKLADFAAAVSSGEPLELQSVLESTSIEERLQKSLYVLKKELANAKLQQEISKEVDKKITRKQQEYFLMEQLKGIKKELGMESDGKDKLVTKFKERAEKLNMPEAIKKVFDEEIGKLQNLEPQASEFNVTRNYLDWLTLIPWGRHSKENFDIKHAMEVLDEDHYGLKDVKDRILEFIAVGKLRGTVEGKIICMVGPPGVGKTSVGKSIARALGREFFRFSVGGLTDVAEIKGHRRTYVGAMPGKVIQALKKVQTENPLIMIDEIDKLGRGHQGDPASALLELLDPEQNSSFLDHYMDVPLDLSKVLFVCTANSLDTIPGPLLDRMEVITLSGYVAEEKVAIAMKYLSPNAREASGLSKEQVELEEGAVEVLIRNYCRESGVRNLKKHVDKVYRKAAFRVVQRSQDEESKKGEKKDGEEPAKLVISKENLKDFVGSPVYTSDRMYDTTPAGVIMGLAWTNMGGSSLYIESVLDSSITESSKPSFHRTGQMGDVMKESSTIAYTFSKAFMAKHFPDNKFFDKASVHMHVPEGATPKDGPSAGTTMTTSLLSLALDTPAIANVAMTGELTLTGKVLKIGGVKEKTIAAKRSGVENIIFPASNKSDWDELPAYIKDGLTPHFVSWYHEIFAIVFPGLQIKK